METTDTTDMMVNAALAGRKVSEARLESLRRAVAAGASPEVLATLARAKRVSRGGVIVLPAGPHQGLSRGSGWCRRGTGDDVQWAERTDAGGYRVTPGRWVVGSSDGFRRSSRDTWTVKAVQVGEATWTVAN